MALYKCHVIHRSEALGERVRKLEKKRRQARQAHVRIDFHWGLDTQIGFVVIRLIQISTVLLY
jgi:hypothetical protein